MLSSISEITRNRKEPCLESREVSERLEFHFIKKVWIRFNECAGALWWCNDLFFWSDLCVELHHGVGGKLVDSILLSPFGPRCVFVMHNATDVKEHCKHHYDFAPHVSRFFSTLGSRNCSIATTALLLPGRTRNFMTHLQVSWFRNSGSVLVVSSRYCATLKRSSFSSADNSLGTHFAATLRMLKLAWKPHMRNLHWSQPLMQSQKNYARALHCLLPPCIVSPQ